MSELYKCICGSEITNKPKNISNHENRPIHIKYTDELERKKSEKENCSNDIIVSNKSNKFNILKEKISEIFHSYESNDFFKLPKEKALTIYEESVGFNEESRCGSKQFNNKLGLFMEDIYNLSDNYKKIENGSSYGSNDGISDTTLFEAKSKYNTMNGKSAVPLITEKLNFAIKENKNFNLLILTDEKDKNRDIPLHEGNSLFKIKNVNGYNPEKHRWISGDNIYKLLFPEYGLNVKKIILNLLKNIKKSR